MIASGLYSRLVFIGGLPLDITEAELISTFALYSKASNKTDNNVINTCRYGKMHVRWPEQNKRIVINGKKVGTGYVFIVYSSDQSVQRLVNQCYQQDNRLLMTISSRTVYEKIIQIRPWRHADAEYKPKLEEFCDGRNTIFIGGLPRPTKAVDLVTILEPIFGRIRYASIDVDEELYYPKGAARINFASSDSFVAALKAHFVDIPDTDGGEKRVELKPYVLDDQLCDNCDGRLNGYHNAPYFCGHVTCLQYYCELCWDRIHYGNEVNQNGVTTSRQLHRPFMRMGERQKNKGLRSLPPEHLLEKINSGIMNTIE